MTVRKPKVLMDTTDSSALYKKARKRYLEGRGISCGFCRYHRGENAHKYQRSWKKRKRRVRHQYLSLAEMD